MARRHSTWMSHKAAEFPQPCVRLLPPCFLLLEHTLMKSFKLAFALVCLALVGCGSSSGPIEAPKNATTKPANFAAGSAEAGGGAPAAGGAQPAGAQGATLEAPPPPSGP